MEPVDKTSSIEPDFFAEMARQNKFMDEHETLLEFAKSFSEDAAELKIIADKTLANEQNLSRDLAFDNWHLCVNMDYERSIRYGYFQRAHKILNKIYKGLVNFAIPDCYTNEQENLVKTMPKIDVRFAVDCVEENGLIIVKTPRLPSSQHGGKSKQTQSFCRNYFYSKEVNRLVLETVQDPARFHESINICVLSVYKNGKTQWLTDNDNIDFKTIIDSITEAIGRTDSALSCSLFLASFLSENIDDGTYFVVSEGAGKCPNLDAVKAILGCKFPLKSS